MLSDKEATIIMKLYWRWKNEDTEIEVLTSEGKRIGFIENFSSGKTSMIGGKKFTIERQGVFNNIVYIVDSLDEKAYCEYITKTPLIKTTERYFKSPLFHRDFCFDNKTHCYISENNEFIIDYYKDKGWFKKSGNIYINDKIDNWELMVYCLFYGLSSYLDEIKTQN